VERLFVAVWPPAVVVDGLVEVELGDGMRRVRPERLHITLRFLGDADALAAAEALDGVVLPAATAHVGGSLVVLGRDAVVVGVAGLDELAGAVGRATARLGRPPRERFVGHLTVGRARRPVRPRGTVPPVQFAVTAVDLVRSTAGTGGPTYTTLRTWPLSPSATRS
jgi:RNA 2',3'-cyclic 3'-phosphodiesterase